MLSKMRFHRGGIAPWLFLLVLCLGIFGLPTFRSSETKAQKASPEARLPQKANRSVEKRLSRLEKQLAEIRDLLLRSQAKGKGDPAALPSKELFAPKLPGSRKRRYKKSKLPGNSNNPARKTPRASRLDPPSTTSSEPALPISKRSKTYAVRYTLSATEAKLVIALIHARFPKERENVTMKVSGKQVTLSTTRKTHGRIASIGRALHGNFDWRRWPKPSSRQPIRRNPIASPPKPKRKATDTLIFPHSRSVQTNKNSIVIKQFGRNGKLTWTTELTGRGPHEVRNSKTRIFIFNTSKNEMTVLGASNGKVVSKFKGRKPTIDPNADGS